jgi:hypothetical protein
VTAQADEEARAGLTLVTAAAVAKASALVTPDDPAKSASVLAEAAPMIVEQYGGAAAALALDYYDGLRAAQNVRARFSPDPVVAVRHDLIVGQIAGWALGPLRDIEKQAEIEMAAVMAEVETRMAEVIQIETARSFRETIREGIQPDPDAEGWRRVTRGDGCPFCRMLASKSAVFVKELSARFAAHPNCNCAARPVFNGEDGDEIDVMQYVASQRVRTDEQQAALKQYLHERFDGPKPRNAQHDGPRRGAGFDSLTRNQIELQIRIAEGLKPSEWRTRQLARLRARRRDL